MNKESAKLTDYYSISSGDNLGIGVYYEGTLVEAIETTLRTNPNYDAFQTERLKNTISDAKTQLKAKAKSIKDSDSDYAKAIYSQKITSGANKDKYRYYATIGINDTTNNVDYRIQNNLITHPGDGVPETTGEGTAAKPTGYYVSATDPQATNPFSVDYVVSSYFNNDGTLTDATNIQNKEDIYQVKTWLQGALANLDTVYLSARMTFEQQGYVHLKWPTTGTPIIDETIIKTSDWQAIFGTSAAPKEYTMVDVSNAVKGFMTAGSLLKGETGLVAKYEAAVEKLIENDRSYQTEFKLFEDYSGLDSELYKAYSELKTGVLKAEKGAEEIASFLEEKNINNLYESDVASYLEDAKVIFTENYQNLARNNVSDYRTYKAIYDAFNSYLGHYVKQDTTGNYVATDEQTAIDYTDDAVTSIKNWLDAANRSLSEKAITFEVRAYLSVNGVSDTWANASTFKVSEDTNQSKGDTKVYIGTGDAVDMNAEQAAWWGWNGKVVTVVLFGEANQYARTAVVENVNDSMPTSPSTGDNLDGYKDKQLNANGQLHLACGVGEMTAISGGGTLNYGDKPVVIVQLFEDEDRTELIQTIYIDLSEVK